MKWVELIVVQVLCATIIGWCALYWYAMATCPGWLYLPHATVCVCGIDMEAIVSKQGGRLLIIDKDTGKKLYCPPDFIRHKDRVALSQLAITFNARQRVDIEFILIYEAAAIYTDRRDNVPKRTP